MGNKNKKKKNGGKSAGSKPDSKKDQPKPISNEEQTERIDAALDGAIAAGIPSAAEFKALWKIACTLHDGGMFAKKAKNASAVFTVVMYGREMGLSPMQSLINIDIIDGVPAMSGQLMAAKAEAGGVIIKVLKRDKESCRIELSGLGKDPQEHQWSIEDANDAGLQGKNNWKGYSRAMLYWRAVSEGLKVFCPALLLKCYTFGELTDDRAQDMAGYLTMEDGLESTDTPNPAGSTSPPYESKQRQPAEITDKQIKIIQKYLLAQQIPEEIRASIEKWLDAPGQRRFTHAAEAIARLKKFYPESGNGKSEVATPKQFQLLSNMSGMHHIDDELRDKITIAASKTSDDGVTPSMTKGQASAWIECLKWYQERAAKTDADAGTDGGGSEEKDSATADESSPADPEPPAEEEPKPSPSIPPTGEYIKKRDAKLEELEVEFKRRDPEDTMFYQAVGDYIADETPKRLEDIEAWLASVLTWTLKTGEPG